MLGLRLVRLDLGPKFVAVEQQVEQRVQAESEEPLLHMGEFMLVDALIHILVLLEDADYRPIGTPSDIGRE